MYRKVLMIVCLVAALGFGACSDRQSGEPEPAQPEEAEGNSEILVDGFEQGDTEEWSETSTAAPDEDAAEDSQEKE